MRKGDIIKVSGCVIFNFITSNKLPVYSDCPIGMAGIEIISEPEGWNHLYKRVMAEEKYQTPIDVLYLGQAIRKTGWYQSAKGPSGWGDDYEPAYFSTDKCHKVFVVM